MRKHSLFGALSVGLTLTAAGCGHQVTPDRLYDSQPGKMVVNFSVVGPLDFTNVNYLIVFNTCGVGGEPYANGLGTTYTNYSYAFAVGPAYAGGSVGPVLFEYYISGGALHPFQLATGASTTSFVPDLYGDGTTFQITFTRSQLNNPAAQPVQLVCPAGGSPNAPVWYVNFFTLAPNLDVLDALGPGGPADTSFTLPIDTSQAVQHAIFSNGPAISNKSAQITGGQITSYPAPSASPTPKPTPSPQQTRLSERHFRRALRT